MEALLLAQVLTSDCGVAHGDVYFDVEHALACIVIDVRCDLVSELGDVLLCYETFRNSFFAVSRFVLGR